jgi:hypothetical protein
MHTQIKINNCIHHVDCFIVPFQLYEQLVGSFGYQGPGYGSICQKTNLTQKLKLLGEVPTNYLYYSLTYSFKWKLSRLKTYTCSHYLVLNFYQINEDGIRTCDHLVIKALIPCQIINSTQNLKLLGEVWRYDLYYSLTISTSTTTPTNVYHHQTTSALLTYYHHFIWMCYANTYHHYAWQ